MRRSVSSAGGGVSTLSATRVLVAGGAAGAFGEASWTGGGKGRDAVVAAAVAVTTRSAVSTMSALDARLGETWFAGAVTALFFSANSTPETITRPPAIAAIGARDDRRGDWIAPRFARA